MQDYSHRNWVPQLSQHPTKRPKVVTFAYTSMLEARESWAFFYIYFQKKNTFIAILHNRPEGAVK